MKKNIFKRLFSSYQRFQLSQTPQVNIVIGFFLYILVGTFILALPIFQRVDVLFIDSLFISASAVSTTGLVPISVSGSFNLGGQIVILLLFQVGGIGYMTLTTYYLLYTTNNISHWHKKMLGTAFTMPKSIQIKDFLKSVIYFTIIMETLGAICFFFAFNNIMETGGAVWYSIFHSVSAFCTAGFGLYDNSFIDFQDSIYVNSIISVLAIAGSLGFIVITDLWYRLSGKSKKLTFTTKIVVVGFVVLLLGSTVLTYFFEPSVVSNGESSWLKSFFQAMTAMTTVGFATIPTGSLSLPILLSVIFLMYLGASPSGTAGGLKITTLTAVFAILKSRLKGAKKITFFDKIIPFERLYVATSTFIFYTSLIFFFTFLTSFFENFTFEELLFEVSSALGTVGLSMGITGGLSTAGKILLTVLMFIGRVGVLTFGFALLARERKTEIVHEEGDLAV